MVSLPSHGHSVFYAYVIEINGNYIGSIQKVSIAGSRDQQRIGEIYYNRQLEWREILWGYESVTLDLSHVEFYTNSFLQSIGGEGIVSLEYMNFSFNIVEMQYCHSQSSVLANQTVFAPGTAQDRTEAESAILQRTISYNKCVPTSYTKTIDRGTVHVVEDMKVECTSVSSNEV
jgi:hypothetical protein